MPLCRICSTDKPDARSRKKGKRPLCDGCHAPRASAQYQRSRQYHLDKSLRRRERAYALIVEAKSKPCRDCGVSYPPHVMDLDHIGDKAMALAQARWEGKSEAFVSAEISKCEAVCANCHRERTHQRALTARLLR